MTDPFRVVSVETEILADPANPQLLVHVTDDQGRRGTGETWWGHYLPHLPAGAPVQPYAATVDHLLAPLTVGAEVATVDDIAAWWSATIRATYQYGDDGILRGALSGIDLALWDLLSIASGASVCQLLGGRAHERVRVYASLSWLGSTGAVLADADRAVAAGHRAVKLHESDPALIAEVRASVDPDVALMVDISAHYDAAGAAGLVARLADTGLVWIEEPIFPQRDLAALTALGAVADVPLAAGENELSIDGIGRLAETGAVDVLQPEVAKLGGLTETRHVGAVARRTGCQVAPHNFSMGPSWFASWHLAAHLPEATWLEMPWLPEGQGFPFGLAAPPVVDGTVAAPAGVGLVPDPQFRLPRQGGPARLDP